MGCGAAGLSAVAAAAGLAVATLLQPGAPDGAARGSPGGRVVVGVRSDVSSFNLYTATTAFSQEVIDLLYPRLAEEQDDFGSGPPSFSGRLASSWEFSADGLTLTIHLDSKARWSDGEPITAADVLFSHEAARSPDVAWAGRDVKDFIVAASAPDPATVVFRFSRRYPYRLMDAVEGNILPARAYSTIPFAQWVARPWLEAPSPGGPYRLIRYEPRAVIELARNPAYHRAPLPGLDAVLFRVIPDEETLLNELVAGGIDVMENVPPRSAARIEATGRHRIVRVPDLSYTFICWNVGRPLFADPRVRRALAMAIDRDAMIEAVQPGVGRLLAGPILSFMWAADPSLRPLPFDPAGAGRLLEQAGWVDRDGDGVREKDGVRFRFELEVSQGSGARMAAAELAAAGLRRVGVEAIPRSLEAGAFVTRHEKHDFDAFVGSWRESTKVDLRSVFHSHSREGGYNYGQYANASLDELIETARSESDTARARDLWHRAQRLIAEDQPYTFLFQRDRLHAVPIGLKGMRRSPRSLYAGMEEWHWQAEARSSP